MAALHNRLCSLCEIDCVARTRCCKFSDVVSLQDVADAAGVSRSVASRALTGDMRSRVSPVTRERVREIAARMSYVADQRGRALRTSRAGAIALVVPDVSNAVFAELQRGVDSVVQQHNSAVLLSHIRDDHDLDAIVGRGRVDGVILQRAETMDDDALQHVLRTDVPTVTFNSRVDGRSGSVILADETGAKVATQHLIDLGHCRIGFLGGRQIHDAARRRRTGFLACMDDNGLAVDPDTIVEGGWEADAGMAAMAILLALPKPPTAVVVASVNAGLGALSVALNRGLRVPEDISLVAVQDTWFAAITRPSLSVVQMPMREAGRAAAEMIYRALAGEDLSDVEIREPAPHLVVRDSSSSPR